MPASDPRAPGWTVGDCLDLMEQMLDQLAARAGRTRAQEATHWPLPPRPPIYRLPERTHR